MVWQTSNVFLTMSQNIEVRLTLVMIKKFLFVNEREKKIRFVLVHSKVRKVLKRFILRSQDAGFLPFLPLFFLVVIVSNWR